jgi:hypothetical protein
MQYILWGLPFAALQMMIADAPRYVSSRNGRRINVKNEEELKKFLV